MTPIGQKDATKLMQLLMFYSTIITLARKIQTLVQFVILKVVNIKKIKYSVRILCFKLQIWRTVIGLICIARYISDFTDIAECTTDEDCHYHEGRECVTGHYSGRCRNIDRIVFIEKCRRINANEKHTCHRKYTIKSIDFFIPKV